MKLYTEIPKEHWNDKPKYEELPWSAEDCVPSVWINRHTQNLANVVALAEDRFGALQLMTEDFDPDDPDKNILCFVSFWRKDDQGNEILVVEHWDRYDTMGEEEKIERARARVRHCDRDYRREKEAFEKGDNWRRHSVEREKEGLDEAQALLREMTGGEMSRADVNLTVAPGEQMAMF